MKKTTIQLSDNGTQFNFIDKVIYPQIGVKYGDSNEEWINIGKYTISDQTTNRPITKP
jgi:hypothetical protein